MHRSVSIVRKPPSKLKRAAVAAAVGLVALSGWSAALWSESQAYADLSDTALQRHVGIRGSCCSPGLKESCGDVIPLKCVEGSDPNLHPRHKNIRPLRQSDLR